jgi:hypothetical protein
MQSQLLNSKKNLSNISKIFLILTLSFCLSIVKSKKSIVYNRAAGLALSRINGTLVGSNFGFKQSWSLKTIHSPKNDKNVECIVQLRNTPEKPFYLVKTLTQKHKNDAVGSGDLIYYVSKETPLLLYNVKQLHSKKRKDKKSICKLNLNSTDHKEILHLLETNFDLLSELGDGMEGSVLNELYMTKLDNDKLNLNWAQNSVLNDGLFWNDLSVKDFDLLKKYLNSNSFGENLKVLLAPYIESAVNHTKDFVSKFEKEMNEGEARILEEEVNNKSQDVDEDVSSGSEDNTDSFSALSQELGKDMSVDENIKSMISTKSINDEDAQISENHHSSSDDSEQETQFTNTQEQVQNQKITKDDESESMSVFVSDSEDNAESKVPQKSYLSFHFKNGNESEEFDDKELLRQYQRNPHKILSHKPEIYKKKAEESMSQFLSETEKNSIQNEYVKSIPSYRFSNGNNSGKQEESSKINNEEKDHESSPMSDDDHQSNEEKESLSENSETEIQQSTSNKTTVDDNTPQLKEESEIRSTSESQNQTESTNATSEKNISENSEQKMDNESVSIAVSESASVQNAESKSVSKHESESASISASKTEVITDNSNQNDQSTSEKSLGSETASASKSSDSSKNKVPLEKSPISNKNELENKESHHSEDKEHVSEQINDTSEKSKHEVKTESHHSEDLVDKESHHSEDVVDKESHHSEDVVDKESHHSEDLVDKESHHSEDLVDKESHHSEDVVDKESHHSEDVVDKESHHSEAVVKEIEESHHSEHSVKEEKKSQKSEHSVIEVNESHKSEQSLKKNKESEKSNHSIKENTDDNENKSEPKEVQIEEAQVIKASEKSQKESESEIQKKQKLEKLKKQKEQILEFVKTMPDLVQEELMNQVNRTITESNNLESMIEKIRESMKDKLSEMFQSNRNLKNFFTSVMMSQYGHYPKSLPDKMTFSEFVDNYKSSEIKEHLSKTIEEENKEFKLNLVKPIMNKLQEKFEEIIGEPSEDEVQDLHLKKINKLLKKMESRLTDSLPKSLFTQIMDKLLSQTVDDLMEEYRAKYAESDQNKTYKFLNGNDVDVNQLLTFMGYNREVEISQVQKSVMLHVFSLKKSKLII